MKHEFDVYTKLKYLRLCGIENTNGQNEIIN